VEMTHMEITARDMTSEMGVWD